MTALWHGLDAMSGKTQMLYEEWRHLFAQVADYEAMQVPNLIALEQEYGFDSGGGTSRLLFALHTYYALIIKLLAAEILTLVRRGMERSFVDQAAAPNDDAD